MNKWRRSPAGYGRTGVRQGLKYDKGHMTSVEECQRRARRVPRHTHLNTSSRLRLPPSDALRPFSSRKHGEYRASILLPPVLEACITPETNSLAITIQYQRLTTITPTLITSHVTYSKKPLCSDS